MTFNYISRAVFLSNLRERYRDSSGIISLKIADWIFKNMTNAEVQSAFGVGPVLATAILNRCQTKSNILASILSAMGE